MLVHLPLFFAPAGLFFASYAGMQIPANMAMTKFGGPRWLGTIALCWGIVAACFALIKTIPVFLALRTVLGFFEAGALPGRSVCGSFFYNPALLQLHQALLQPGALAVLWLLWLSVRSRCCNRCGCCDFITSTLCHV